VRTRRKAACRHKACRHLRLLDIFVGHYHQQKIWLYNVIVLSVATYARDTWKMTVNIAQELNVFHQQCLRKLLHISYLDHITNEEVPKRAGSTKLQDTVTERRFRLAGHILRLPSHRHSNIAMRWTPVGGTRKRGRPKKTWRRTLQEDLGASTYHGTRRRHWRLTDHPGGKLLPNVPCCTAGTKSK